MEVEETWQGPKSNEWLVFLQLGEAKEFSEAQIMCCLSLIVVAFLRSELDVSSTNQYQLIGMINY